MIKEWIKKNKAFLIITFMFLVFSVVFSLISDKGDNIESVLNSDTEQSTEYGAEVSGNDDYFSIIKAGVENLKSLEGNYLIVNTMEVPTGGMNYIEVNTPSGNYTEYPIDKEGNYGTIKFGESEDTEYILYDYLTSDKELYLMNSSYNSSDSENSYMWLHMPKSYAEDVASRKCMYVDVMLDSMYDISFEGEEDVNGELLSIYSVKIPSEIVRKICGIDSIGLYEHIREDNINNKNVVSLMDTYINSLDMDLTFSYGNVILGINQNGVLCQMQLESGGLGTRMYYNKSLVQDTQLEVRDKPDLTNSDNYINNILNLSDYVASFDSYEEAMDSLYNSSTTFSDDVLNNIESTEATE